METGRRIGGGAGVLMVAAVAAIAGAVASPLGVDGQTRGGDLRVAVVDLANVFKGYDRSQELEEQINSERDAMAQSLEELRDLIRDIEKELDLLEYGSEAYELKEEERQLEIARFEHRKRRIDNTLKQRIVEYELTLINDIEEVVKQYGAENGYTLVLQVAGGELTEEHRLMAGPQAILYYSDQVDITEETIALLNRRYALDGGSGGIPAEPANR